MLKKYYDNCTKFFWINVLGIPLFRIVTAIMAESALEAQNYDLSATLQEPMQMLSIMASLAIFVCLAYNFSKMAENIGYSKWYGAVLVIPVIGFLLYIITRSDARKFMRKEATR